MLVVKNLPTNAGNETDVCFTPGLGKSPGIGNGNPLQYSCLENSMVWWAWQAMVQGDHRKSDTTEYARYYSPSLTSETGRNTDYYIFLATETDLGQKHWRYLGACSKGRTSDPAQNYWTDSIPKTGMLTEVPETEPTLFSWENWGRERSSKSPHRSNTQNIWFWDQVFFFLHDILPLNKPDSHHKTFWGFHILLETNSINK